MQQQVAEHYYRSYGLSIDDVWKRNCQVALEATWICSVFVTESFFAVAGHSFCTETKHVLLLVCWAGTAGGFCRSQAVHAGFLTLSHYPCFLQPLEIHEFWSMRQQYLLSASRTQTVFCWETVKASLLEHVLLIRDQSIPDLSDYNIKRKAL